MELDVTTFAELEGFYRSFQAGHFRLLVVDGPPGLEKTTLARTICTDAVYIVCNVSPFQLYRLLYQYRNQDFILDDVDHLQRDPEAVRLLKALTDSQEPRIVAWHKASPLLAAGAGTEDGDSEPIPMEFETASNVVLVTNGWRELGANVRALADRGMLIHFHPTTLEIHQRVGRWFADPEIHGFIGTHLHLISHHSMRIYLDALKLKAAGHDWRHCLWRHWQVDAATVAVGRLLADSSLTMKQRARRFVADRLGSRATFYRKVRLLKGTGDSSETVRLAVAQPVSPSHASDTVSLGTSLGKALVAV